MPNISGLPNLDTLTIPELREAWKWFHCLSRYADEKQQAIRARELGNIAEAQMHEAHCDALYRDLPTEWRW